MKAVRTASVMAVCFVLVACGIRLETPPPSPLSPGANEVARQSAVDSILTIEATALALEGEGDSKEVDEQISTIAREARAHIDALGGPYDSGLGPEPTDPATSPIDEEVQPTVEDLYTMLVQSALRVRATLPLVPDDSLARLLSSISLAHTQRAYDLSDLTGLEIDLDDLAAPEPHTTGGAASDVGQAVPEVVEGTRSADPDEPDLSDEAASPVVTRETHESRVPIELPDGVPAERLIPVIVDEDALGYIQEIRASRLTEEARDQEFARAGIHRNRARDWVQLAELAYTDDDPRQLRYHLRADLGGDDVADELQAQVREQLVALTDHYVSLVPDVEAADRTVFHDLALVTMLEGWNAGQDFGPFPGMPDLTR